MKIKLLIPDDISYRMTHMGHVNKCFGNVINKYPQFQLHLFLEDRKMYFVSKEDVGELVEVILTDLQSALEKCGYRSSNRGWEWKNENTD